MELVQNGEYLFSTVDIHSAEEYSSFCTSFIPIPMAWCLSTTASLVQFTHPYISSC